MQVLLVTWQVWDAVPSMGIIKPALGMPVPAVSRSESAKHSAGPAVGEKGAVSHRREENIPDSCSFIAQATQRTYTTALLSASKCVLYFR